MVTVVNEGLEQMARLICGATTSTTYFETMAIGWGSTAEANSQSSLDHEITASGGARSHADTHAYEADYKSKWAHTWTFSGATTIREVGVFNNLSLTASTMLLRHVFASNRTVGASDTLTITIRQTLARS